MRCATASSRSISVWMKQDMTGAQHLQTARSQGNPPQRMATPVFRFAPSPNGYLHLGHALSALINCDMARATGGRLILRIEDIDASRCRPEFEEAIYEHPAVDEVTVIGVPDKYRGEAPKAFVKLKPDMTLTPTEILKHLESKLSRIEMPAQIELRDKLPKTMIGKLSKKELKAEEAQRQREAPAK